MYQQSKTINSTQSSFDRNNTDEKKVGALKENIELALFKLKSLTEQICSIADAEDFEKSKQLYDENSERRTFYLYVQNS